MKRNRNYGIFDLLPGELRSFWVGLRSQKGVPNENVVISGQEREVNNQATEGFLEGRSGIEELSKSIIISSPVSAVFLGNAEEEINEAEDLKKAGLIIPSEIKGEDPESPLERLLAESSKITYPYLNRDRLEEQRDINNLLRIGIREGARTLGIETLVEDVEVYGSTARGTSTDESDFDLALSLKDKKLLESQPYKLKKEAINAFSDGLTKKLGTDVRAKYVRVIKEGEDYHYHIDFEWYVGGKKRQVSLAIGKNEQLGGLQYSQFFSKQISIISPSEAARKINDIVQFKLLAKQMGIYGPPFKLDIDSNDPILKNFGLLSGTVIETLVQESFEKTMDYIFRSSFENGEFVGVNNLRKRLVLTQQIKGYNFANRLSDSTLLTLAMLSKRFNEKTEIISREDFFKDYQALYPSEINLAFSIQSRPQPREIKNTIDGLVGLIREIGIEPDNVFSIRPARKGQVDIFLSLKLPPGGSPQSLRFMDTLPPIEKVKAEPSQFRPGPAPSYSNKIKEFIRNAMSIPLKT